MPEATKIKGELMQKAVQKVLEDAKVPMQHHLKLLKEFHNNLQENSKERKMHESVIQAHERAMADHETRNKKVEQMFKEHINAANQRYQDFDNEISRVKEIKEGAPGLPGQDADPEAIIQEVLSRIPIPKDGDPGKDGEDAEEPDVNLIVEQVVKYIKEKQAIDMSHIKGAQSFIKDGVSYKFEELMHGGGQGGSSGTQVYNEIVAGSGTTFTLAFTPTAGTAVVYGNGQRLTPGAGNDYTISGKVITTANSFGTGTILADYSHS